MAEENSGMEEKEMSFLDHLEELRKTILKSLFGLVIGTAVSFIFVDFFVDKVLLYPAKIANFKLQNLKPFGQLMMYFQVAFVGGLILSLPLIVYQIWKFIAPALHSNEKRYVKAVVFFTTSCFLSGLLFGYYVMLPVTLKFAAGFGSISIENNFALDEYISIILSILLAAGVVFELPVMSFFLTKIGILNPRIMRKYWRHSIVVIMILAALLTPGTDPVSQILLAIPLVFLYEISIFVSKIAERKS